MTPRSVPFFNYPHVFLDDEAELTAAFQDVGRRGAFIQQRDLQEFEQRIADYVGARYVLGFANATDALHLAMRAVGIGPGDEVIFCSHTMVATAASVHYAGGTPVPIDCGADHLMDPAKIEAAITPRTKAILPTHLNGRTCDMDAICRIAEKHQLLLLEDAAQALGSRFRGRAAGTFGLAACISFYPAKTLGCLGDGGCLITNDEQVYQHVHLLRDHGRDATGEVRVWGLNSRLDNLQAAFLNVKFKKYARAIARRREIAALYCELLQGVPGITLPPPPDSDPRHFDIFQNFEMQSDRRDALQAHLKSRGIGTLIQWGGKAVHQFPGLGLQAHLPYTDALFRRLIMLPINTSLSNDDVRYVAHWVKDFHLAQSDSRTAAA